MPRMLLRIAAALGAVLAVAAIAAWLLRDEPRRRVASTVAAKLEARAELGAFAIEGTTRFVLRDLVLTRIAGQDRVRRVAIETLTIEGAPRAILRGRFTSIAGDGIEIVLGAPDPDVPAPSGPPAPIVAERVTLGRVRVVVEGRETRAAFDVDAAVTGVGGDLAGTARVRADRVPLAPLLEALAGGSRGLDGTIDGFQADVRFSPHDSSLSLDAAAGRARLTRAGRTIAIPDPRLDIRVVPGAGGAPATLEAAAHLAGIEDLRARGTIGDLDITAKGIDLARWLPAVPGFADALEVTGRADVSVVRRGERSLDIEANAWFDRVAHPPLLEESAGTLRASTTLDATRLAAGGPITIAANLAHARMRGIALPPSSMEAEGTFSVDDEPAFAGRARFTFSAIAVEAEEVEARLGEAPRVRARFRVAPAEIPALVALASEAGLAVPARIALGGRVTASGTATWPCGPEPCVRATIDAAPLEVASVASLANTRADLAWQGPGGALVLRSLEADGTIEADPLAPVPVTIAASGRVSPDALLAVRADAPGLATASIDLAGRLDGKMAANVTIDGVDVERLRTYLQPLTGPVAPGHSTRGSVRADLRVGLVPAGDWTASGTASIRGSGFASNDGARVVEGLDTTWTLAVEGHALDRVVVDATAAIGGFQLLWGSFFADYASVPATFRGRGRWERGTRTWDGEGTWSYADGPRIAASFGGVGSGPIAYAARLEVADLAATLARYLRAPLGDSVPWFTRIDGAGAIRAEARGSLSRNVVTSAGRVALDDVRLEGTRGLIEVAGLALDLPFDVRVARASAGRGVAIDGPPLTGALGFDRLDLGGLTIDATATPLTIAADSVGLEEPLAIPILGGALGFEKLRLVDALRPSRRLETAVLVEGVELDDVSRTFGLPPLDGEIDGWLPRAVLTGPELVVDGGGEVRIFGGRARIDGISGEDLLSRSPRLNVSAVFEEVDLAAVTKTFDFGDMTGRVSGHVRHLQLFRGVATRFDARIESVRGRREHRRINVRAINNIAILGGGDTIGILDRGLHKFLDEYAYEALGLTVQLFGDRFVMRGLERRRGRELFIKGDFPFPIDIANATPGRSVSFRAMLDRIGNLKVGTPPPATPRQ